MKKTIALLCMAAGLFSCAKEIAPQEESAAGVPVAFEINVAETKAAKTAWADGDKIYVFFNGLADKYLVLSYDGSSWANAAGGDAFVDSDFNGLGTKTLTAVHFPVAVDVAYADGKFSFTSGGKPVYNYYLFETGKTYTVDGTTVTATLALGKPEGIALFHVPDIQGSITGYTFGCSKIQPVACASVGADGAITESVLQAGARLSGIADSDGGIFAGRLSNAGTKAVATPTYTFTLTSPEKIYTYNLYDKTLEAGKMYNLVGLGKWEEQNASDLYVDLGLPSGVKWAKWNLGATKPEEYGNYFSWGEISGFNSGKTDFSWSTYFDNPSGDGSTFTKYAKDKKKVLEPEDDAAYAALGGIFRMPTIADWEELDNNTVSNWTTRNGICGRLFTASNGNSIFLPAAGGRYSTSLYGADSYGLYWSSSLGEFSSDAGRVYFDSKGVSRDGSNRDYGLSVRPVWK